MSQRRYFSRLFLSPLFLAGPLYRNIENLHPGKWQKEVPVSDRRPEKYIELETLS